MLVKLIAVALLVSLASAKVTIFTYSDNACATPVAMFTSSELSCTPPPAPAKRFAAQATACLTSSSNVYYKFLECEQSQTEPAFPNPPAGWQFITFTRNEGCDFTKFSRIGVAQAGARVTAMIYTFDTSLTEANITINCNSGKLDLSSCPVGVACTTFQGVPNNVCNNVTVSGVANEVASGRQTSCVGAPQASSPVASAPVASTPSSAPTQAPSRRSDAPATFTVGVVIAFISVVTLVF